jgi:hypothetical protein
MWRNPLGRISSIPPKLVQLPLEQCLWEVKMCAACRRGRVEPHRGLDAAEEFQPKLLLLLNSQMFVQGFDSENGPAILLMLLSSLNRQRFVGHRRSCFSKQWIENSRVSSKSRAARSIRSYTLPSYLLGRWSLR